MKHCRPGIVLIAALVLVVGFPAAAGSVQDPNAGTQATETAPAFHPLVDYHQHLASPAGVALLNRTLPPVVLPPEVAAMMNVMTDHWNEPAALRPLYTDDAIVLANQAETLRGWVRGAGDASEYIGNLYGRPYRITPVFYAADGDHARVAGYFTRGEGEDARNFAYFYFQLVRSVGGSWQIAADTRTFEPRPRYEPTISGEQLLALLDAAGIRQAVVLSDAYWFDAPRYVPPGQPEAETYARVRAENDWTAAQAAASGGRLVAFCSFNPLADHAIAELNRCASSGRFAGLKLHLQTAGVDLTDPAQAAKVRAVFARANRLRFPIIVHAQTADHYGREAAEVFIGRVLPAAPDIPVTIAHLWGGGPFAPEALGVYVHAVAAHSPQTRNLYFDVAEAALVAGGNRETQQAIAAAIRQIGPRRILFGSDAVGPSALAPERAAAQFRSDIPLTEQEFAIIERNLLPYMQPR